MAKKNFFDRQGNMLNNPNIGQKKYWSILKSFLHKQKIPNIPPLISNDMFVTDFSSKASLFNDSFANQCAVVDTPSVIPTFSYKTNFRIESLDFDIGKISLLIGSLDGKKAYGWNDISSKMLKICGDSIALPLKLIFEKAFSNGQFPDKLKKANVIPIHKKTNKNDIKNYRPVSLLPLLGKIFEKYIFDSLYEYFEGQ